MVLLLLLEMPMQLGLGGALNRRLPRGEHPEATGHPHRRRHSGEAIMTSRLVSTPRFVRLACCTYRLASTQLPRSFWLYSWRCYLFETHIKWFVTPIASNPSTMSTPCSEADATSNSLGAEHVRKCVHRIRYILWSSWRTVRPTTLNRSLWIISSTLGEAIVGSCLCGFERRCELD